MKRMISVILLAAWTAACASAGPRSGDDLRAMLRLAGSRESNPPRDGSEVFYADTLDVPAGRAFQELRGAYTTLQIPFSYFEQEQLELGGLVRVLGDLGRERPSAWIDCGRGMTAEPYADAYTVSLVIASRVRAIDPLSSTVETVLRARARATAVSGDLIRCRSLGTLEGRIAELMTGSVAD